MNKNEKKIVGVIAIAAIIFVFAAQGGYLTQYGIKPFFATTGVDTGPEVTDEMADDYRGGIGKFQLSCSSSDSMKQATSRTIGTNLDVIWWHYTSGQWISEITYTTASTCYYDAKAEDNGYAWISVEPKASQQFYVDYTKIKSADSYVVGYQYVDVDADSDKEFVFQYALKGHSIPSSGYPVLSFKAFLLTYDNATTLTGAANQTGWGTSTVTKYFENYDTISAETYALAVYKVEVILNETVQTLVTLKSMTIPGLGKVSKSAFTESFTTTDIRWSYTFSTGFDGALYITRPIGSIGKDYWTCEYEATLTTGEYVEMDLKIYYLVSPTEAGSSLTCWNVGTQA